MNKQVDRIKRVLKKKLASRYEFQYLRMIKKKPVNDNSILVESTHGKDFSGHVFYVTKYISNAYPGFTVRIAISSEKKEWLQKLMLRHNIANVEIVEYLSKDYIRALATSKYLVNDTSFWAFFNKRPDQIYINIWHGTPLKCLGKDNSLVGFGNVQKNFLASDFLVFSNEFTRDKMVNAYNLNNIATTKVVLAPSPRNSVLLDAESRVSTRNELGLSNKKVYMYMPTYRDDGTSAERIEELIDTMESSLNEDELLFVKLHPFDAEKISFDFTKMERVKAFPKDYETYEFLTVVDVLITDYSSIMYDFLCTGRNIFLYTYDKAEYFSTRGMYEDIDDFPLPQFKTSDELIAALHNKNIDYADFAGEQFKDKYIQRDNINGVAQTVDFLLRGKVSNNITISTIRNEKDNVIFYAGGLWDNGISRAFFNTLDAIDLSEKNYILFLIDGSVKKEHVYKLAELKIPYILSSGKTQYNFIDGIFTYLYLNTEFFGRKFFRKAIEKRVFQMYQLDFRRMFNSLEISQFIHYTGFERSFAAILSAISGDNIRTTAFYHTDMFKEYKMKHNLNMKTMVSMYRHIDQIVPISDDLKKTLLSNQPSLNNIIVMDNFLGYKKIREDSKESIFSAMLGISLQFEDEKTLGNHIIDSYGKTNTDVFQNNNAAIRDLKLHALGERGPLPFIDQNFPVFVEAINAQMAKAINLNNKIDFKRIEMPYVYGGVQLKLMDDLYNPKIKVFINIGRFSVEKGHERLIKAFSVINKKYPDTRLVIVAPHGPLKGKTIQCVRDYNLEENVIILGGMKNPYSLLKMCDALVFTSLYEGLGLVVFEALSVGTDVITVDIPATTDALIHGSREKDYLPALITKNNDKALIAGWLRYMEEEIKFGEYDFEAAEQKSLNAWEKVIN